MLCPPGPGRTVVTVYIPHHFLLSDRDAIASFVERAGTAELVTFDGVKPVATLIPVLWEPAPAGSSTSEDPDRVHGRLLGHLARANPQHSTVAAGSQALAIVTGPQAYVSPSWYPSTAEHGRVVPTWNYVSVHFTGELLVHDDPQWLRDVVTRLTQRHEAGRPRPWSPDDAPAGFIEGQLRAIVGVEMLVASVEAKHKLSQNREAADAAGALAGLRAEPSAAATAVADLMARLT